MVDATLRAGTQARRCARVSARMQLGWASAVADALAMAVSFLAAVAIRAFAPSAIGRHPAQFAPGWSIAILVAISVSVFYVSGLYEPEVYVSRPLHLWTLLKASLTTLGVSALLFYLIGSMSLDRPHLVLLITFILFILLACVLRLAVLDGLYSARVRQRGRVSILVGESAAVRDAAEASRPSTRIRPLGVC